MVELFNAQYAANPRRANQQAQGTNLVTPPVVADPAVAAPDQVSVFVFYFAYSTTTNL
jgi:hypothetical protein